MRMKGGGDETWVPELEPSVRSYLHVIIDSLCEYGILITGMGAPERMLSASAAGRPKLDFQHKKLIGHKKDWRENWNISE